MKNNFARPNAVAFIKGGPEAPSLMGSVKFYQRKGGVLVVANMTGLPESTSGFFALHIHEGNSCTGEGFADTKGHYNPKNRPHPEHAGDLPPLLSASNDAYMSVFTNRFSVAEIIGRTVVIHSGPDDFRTQPAGDSGMKIACGVIRRN